MSKCVKSFCQKVLFFTLGHKARCLSLFSLLRPSPGDYEEIACGDEQEQDEAEEEEEAAVGADADNDDDGNDAKGADEHVKVQRVVVIILLAQ
jgi:hypothetical protein